MLACAAPMLRVERLKVSVQPLALEHADAVRMQLLVELRQPRNPRLVVCVERLVGSAAGVHEDVLNGRHCSVAEQLRASIVDASRSSERGRLLALERPDCGAHKLTHALAAVTVGIAHKQRDFVNLSLPTRLKVKTVCNRLLAARSLLAQVAVEVVARAQLGAAVFAAESVFRCNRRCSCGAHSGRRQLWPQAAGSCSCGAHSGRRHRDDMPADEAEDDRPHLPRVTVSLTHSSETRREKWTAHKIVGGGKPSRSADFYLAVNIEVSAPFHLRAG